jgi:uracil-DNA glycosylase family 4
MLKIDVLCDRTNCPVFKKCCYLPTEYFLSPEGSVDILFVGQGGGKDERKKNRPFIGRAGIRLRQMIVYLRVKLNRQFGVAFSNTIRDNPEDNRPPDDDELDFCLPYLYRDIVELKAKGLKCVVPLGNASKRALIEESHTSMDRDHGVLYKVSNEVFGAIMMIPTYHPSYLCRNHQVWHPNKPGEFEIEVLKDIERALNL